MGENEQEPAPSKSDAFFRYTPSGIQPISSPRRNRSAEQGGPEAGQGERLAELNDLADRVHTLSEEIGGIGAPERSPALETRDKPLRRWKKVVRPGADPLREQPGPATSVEAPASASSLTGSLLALPTPAGNAAASSPAPRSVHSPPARKAPRAATRPGAATRLPLTRRHPFLVWVAAQAFCFGLVLIGAWLGEYSATAPVASTPESGSAKKEAKPSSVTASSRFVSEQAFQTINAVLAAGKKGDAAAAQHLIEEAQRREIELPGADYRLVLLAIQRGDIADAQQRLNYALGSGEQSPAMAYIRAAISGSNGKYDAAATSLETAVFSEPFSARYLFFLGEALRRAGKLKEAIERLEWALDRPASPAEAELIALKLRLAKIEAGRQGEFAAELESKLKLEPVSAYWLLTAAAQEIQRADYPAAARFLQKASRVMPTDELNQQMRDYLFTPLSSRKEFAPYFARSGPLTGPLSNISLNSDPASWPLQNGDPAAWATGSPLKGR